MSPYTHEMADADMLAALRAGDEAAALQAAEAYDRMPARSHPRSVTVAAWYASIGVPVFPLRAQAKVPFGGTRGVHDATTDPDVVHAMWDAHPGANIGLATGHRFDVLDLDGPEAHTAWSELFPFPSWEEAGVTVLASVSTPRPGGLHLYVPTTGAGNRAGLFDKKLGRPSYIDYRGLGGYVVAPPSTTPDGRYWFVRSLDPDALR